MAEVVEKSKSWKLPDEMLAYASAMEATLKQSFQTLRSYCGNYYLYYRSPSWPGGVIRSFMSIYQIGSMTYAKSIDRLFWRDKTPSGRSVQKCQSLVLIEGDRLYVIDRNRNQRGDMSMLILLPSNRSQINLIYGLQVSVTGSGARMPFASRAVLKRLDGNVSFRAALKECGVFTETNSSIDPAISADTLNTIAPKDNALVSLAY